MGIKRIHLKAGESKTVEFVLSPRNLSLVNEIGERKVFPGMVNLQISGSQVKGDMLNNNLAVERKVQILGEEYLVFD